MDTKVKMIQAAKEHLHSIFPHSKKIDIKYHVDEEAQYHSSIHMKSPSGRDFYAHKKDVSLKASLDKSTHAIVRQIHRIKTKWDKRHRDFDLNQDRDDFQQSA